jgi:uncharacterized protein YgiM (DUF1202 family)
MRKYLMGLFLALFTIAAIAQSNECYAVVQEVSQALEKNCANLVNNSVCYGYYHVEAEFAEPVTFSEPSDIASIDGLLSLHTAPFDEATGVWGIALIRSQADLPNTLPGQSVTFMLLGDSRVTTALEETSFVPAEPITVVAQINANIRRSPSNEGTVIASVAAGTELPADAQNNGWYRVVIHEQVGWIAGAVIDNPEGLNALPYYDGESRASMQAFYFTTGIGQPNCEAAPNEILIQSSSETALNITVNGVEIATTGATLGLSNPTEGQMQVSVLEGDVEVDGVVIPPNYAATGDLDGDNNYVPRSVGGQRPLTDEERKKYEDLRDAGISEVFDIPEIIAPVVLPTATPNAAGEENSSSTSGETSDSSSGGGEASGSDSPNQPTMTATRGTRPPEYPTPTEDPDCVQPPCGDDGSK